MKLSKKLNIFKKSCKLVKKLWKKTKKGKKTNRELEPVNVEMLNSNSIIMETSKCNKNLISEDVISETSYVSLTSAVRGESTSEESGASVDLNLEKPSIVYAPEFIQNEGGEKNMPLSGVEPETKKSESKNSSSEESITAEKPVSVLSTSEKTRTGIEDDHGRTFYSKSRYTLTRLLYAPKVEEPRTYQTPEEFIAQIEDALSQLPEPDFTFFISTPGTNNDIASVEPDNTTPSPDNNDLPPSPDTDNTTSFPENTTSFHTDINISSHSENILPVQNTDDISHSSENSPLENALLPDNSDNISLPDTNSLSSHSDISHSHLTHNIVDSLSEDTNEDTSSTENDIAAFISSLSHEDNTTNAEDDIAAFIFNTNPSNIHITKKT